ncbi:MAG: cytochrome c oxidase subunit II [Solirubrobacterales bacterium]|nr:cytochrome c oxidase subunit II [Solirubrobacterales bacterium]
MASSSSLSIWQFSGQFARAIARYPRDPGRRPGNSKVGLGLGVVALAIFVTATIFSDQSRVVPVSAETVAGMTSDKQLEIEATGSQWLWRFNYPRNGAFSYRRVVVPAGVTVAMKLKSSDVIHGWNVPSLTGKADAIPGKTNPIYFRADQEGTHGGRSAILSGQGYSTMSIEVDVVSPDEYKATSRRRPRTSRTRRTRSRNRTRPRPRPPPGQGGQP